MAGGDPPMDTRVLLERDQELRLIDRVLGRASGGEGTIVLIEGQAGIGKTALLSAARASARRRAMTTLAAAGRELEEHFPYGVVRQLFEPVVRSSAKPRVELLTGSARLAAPIVLDAGEPPAAGAAQTAAFGHLHGQPWPSPHVYDSSRSSPNAIEAFTVVSTACRHPAADDDPYLGVPAKQTDTDGQETALIAIATRCRLTALPPTRPAAPGSTLPAHPSACPRARTRAPG